MSIDLFSVTDLETLLLARNANRTDQWQIVYSPTLDVCFVDLPQTAKLRWKPEYSTILSASLARKYFPNQPNLVGKTVWMSRDFANKPLSLSISFASSLGGRSYQEDRLDYRKRGNWTAVGVYDGHGGFEVSEFLRDQLLVRLLDKLQDVDPANELEFKRRVEELWLQVDQEIFKVPSLNGVGSTAVVCLKNGGNCYLINVGDSRAVVSNDGTVIASTLDDKPLRDDEKKRIEAAGGFVSLYQGPRVNGVLAVSRSFGDAQVAKDKEGKLSGRGPVSVIPTIQKVNLMEDTKQAMASTSMYSPIIVVLATDGVWDVISNQDAFKVYEKVGLEQSAEALVEEAKKRGSRDNISALFMRL